MKTDTTKLAAELRRYNSWRRNNETIDQPEPMILGKIIENAADRLDELERELADSRQWESKLSDLADDMRADLAGERALADRLAQEFLNLAYKVSVGRALPGPTHYWLKNPNGAVAVWKEARRV